MPNKKALAEVFYYFSEKLPSQKLCYLREGAVSHIVLYYQQLSIAQENCYQESFYANNYQ